MNFVQDYKAEERNLQARSSVLYTFFAQLANLRIQTNPKNASQFPTTSPERYFSID
jgi:hypothetical protein